VEAWEGGDVDAIRSLLTDDAVLAMPPYPTWFRGRDDVADFLARGPLAPVRRWRLVRTRANGQLALGSYRTMDDRPLAAEGLIVLSFSEDGRLSELNAFRNANLFAKFGLPRAIDSEAAADL
jgi:hypothetical protein